LKNLITPKILTHIGNHVMLDCDLAE
jgi:hypothetical protein